MAIKEVNEDLLALEKMIFFLNIVESKNDQPLKTFTKTEKWLLRNYLPLEYVQTHAQQT